MNSPLTAACVSALLAVVGLAQQRPPIVGIANIAVKVDSLDEARKFYSGVLGLEEAFTVKEAGDVSDYACFKVNDRQYVELAPELKSETEDRLIRIGFETTDAHKLWDYLKSRNVDVTPLSSKDANGNLSFMVIDPEGHRVQFIQYLKGSVHSRNFGKHLSPSRISDHILHVGIRVKDPDRADSFYKEVLGFRLLWKGGPTDAHMDWISMLVPDGHDWVEYMVGENEPTPRQLGVMHHYCLGTLDIQAVYKKILDRGNKPPQEPHIARDGRWLMNLFDPDMTRTEVMIPKPVQTPCCSPMRDDTVGLQP